MTEQTDNLIFLTSHAKIESLRQKQTFYKMKFVLKINPCPLKIHQEHVRQTFLNETGVLLTKIQNKKIVLDIIGTILIAYFLQ